MGLNSFMEFPSFRMALHYLLIMFKDMAILDYSTSGHAILNYGHSSRLFIKPHKLNAYSVNLSKTEVALGSLERFEEAVKEIKKDKIDHIFVLPSYLKNLTGLDLNYKIKILSEKYNVNIYTIKDKLDDYLSAPIDYISFLFNTFSIKENILKENTYNIFGGINTITNRKNHSYIESIIKKHFNIKKNFDSLDFYNIKNIEKILSSKINILTDISLVPFFEKLKKEYNIKYVLANELGFDAEEKLLKEFEKVFNKKHKKLDLDQYNYIYNQFVNVLNHSNKQIVCYVDKNSILKLKPIFKDIKNKIEYIDFDDSNSINPNDFLKKYLSKKYLVVSYKRIAKKLKGISINDFGLDYEILTPLNASFFGVNGLYNFINSVNYLI